MRLAVGLAAMVLAAGCGGSSAVQQLRAEPPTTGVQPPPSTAPPMTASPATQAPPTAKPPPSETLIAPAPAASPAGGTAASGSAGTATSGTATAGPGRVTSPPASPSPRPTPSPVGGTVTVTDDDSGTTVQLRRGQHLRVQLSSGTWDPPVSSADGVVVRRSSAGGYPSDQPVDATFDAVGSGSADVTAQSDASCFHTSPRCMMASRQWQVHVVVR